MLVKDNSDVGESSSSLVSLAIADNHDDRAGNVKVDSSILWSGNKGENTNTWTARKLAMPA